ncbi:MAG: sigma-70 family RNA polymerase sigma factor [Deltaproteobacteria bacterium]|nr:sigma-70 family RNA polymerase sigma factor [Deltaproteobacteria bacterium]
MSAKNVLNQIAVNSDRQVIYLDGSRALVQELKDESPEALSALYDEYAAYIQRIVARILGVHSGEIDDCLQEIFINAFYKAKQIKNDNQLKGWLTRIAVNRSLDYLRKKRRENWLHFLSPNAIADIEIVNDNMDDNEAVKAVYQILDTFSVKERVPFTLRYLEEMSLVEIAEATGVSLATVKRRINSANKRFEQLANSFPALENWLLRGTKGDVK